MKIEITFANKPTPPRCQNKGFKRVLVLMTLLALVLAIPASAKYAEISGTLMSTEIDGMTKSELDSLYAAVGHDHDADYAPITFEWPAAYNVGHRVAGSNYTSGALAYNGALPGGLSNAKAIGETIDGKTIYVARFKATYDSAASAQADEFNIDFVTGRPANFVLLDSGGGVQGLRSDQPVDAYHPIGHVVFTNRAADVIGYAMFNTAGAPLRLTILRGRDLGLSVTNRSIEIWIKYYLA